MFLYSPLACWKLAYTENQHYSGECSDGEGNTRVSFSEIFFGSPSFGVMMETPRPGRDESGPYAPPEIAPKDGELSIFSLDRVRTNPKLESNNDL
jgi:hypothetical protein